MKIAIAITVAALAVAGCSEPDTIYVNAPDTTTKRTTDAPKPTTPKLTDEEILVEFVYEEYDNTIYVDDSEIIGVGHAVCDALDNGATPEQIVQTMFDSAEGDTDTMTLLTIITGGATGILCPEYAGIWD